MAPEAERRRFLSGVIVGLQAAIGAILAFVLGGAAAAPAFGSRRTNWWPAAAIDDLTDGEPTPVVLRVTREDGYSQVVDRQVIFLVKVADDDPETIAEGFRAVKAAADAVAEWKPPYRVFKAFVGASLACNAGPHLTDVGLTDGETREIRPLGGLSGDACGRSRRSRADAARRYYAIHYTSALCSGGLRPLLLLCQEMCDWAKPQWSGWGVWSRCQMRRTRCRLRLRVASRWVLPSARFRAM